MNNYIQVLIDLSTTILATIIGVLLFSKLQLFYRLLVAHVLFYLVIDLIGINMSPANTLVYNMFMPIEVALLVYAAFVLVGNNLNRWVFLAAYALFLLVFLWELAPGIFAYRSAMLEGLILTAIYILVLYNVLQKRIEKENALAAGLASLGMVLYFACTIPYLSILYYFQKTNPLVNKELFRYIIVFLALLRYFLIAASFLVAFNKRPLVVNERP